MTPDPTTRKLFWLDCDPGHDDAVAILMALYEPSIELMGISTVHGNASLDNTTINAAKCLEAFGAHKDILVYPGAAKPLLGQPLPAVDIHGNDGLGGVEGLPSADSQRVKDRIISPSQLETVGAIPAIEGIRKAAVRAVTTRRQMYLGVTGSATNAAIFILAFPELARKAIAQIVTMGGGIGVGNIAPSAEFNIFIDPEAAQIMFDAGIPVFSIPLNVTHQAIFHVDTHRFLLDPTRDPAQSTAASLPLPAASSPLRHTLSTLLTFFAQTYKDVFGFDQGPPVHDALVVSYVARPDYFTSQWCRVDAELTGKHTRGALSVDTYNRDPTQVKNVEMALSLNVPAVLNDFFSAVGRADWISKLNAGVEPPRQLSPVPEAALRRASPPSGP